jgi:hypothetical protein
MSNSQNQESRRRHSIEDKIEDMLDRILTDDSEEEKDRIINLEPFDDTSTNYKTLEGQISNYNRKEKKTQSNKEKNVPLYFNQTQLYCNELNYEELYTQQKTLMNRHKKLKTSHVVNPHLLINKFNTLFADSNLKQRSNPLAGYCNVNQFVGRSDFRHKTTFVSKPDINEFINYQNNLFTINDLKGDGLLTDKLEHINLETYEILRGNFKSMIRNQNCSRILQNALGKTDPSILTNICIEILPDFHNLIVDSYGNYFCQKFYTFVKFEERLMLLRHLRKYLLQISNSNIGTYPLQSIIEKLSKPEEKKIICDAIADENVLREICSDQQGVHVIEKIIVCFKEELIPFVYEYILSNFMILANTSTGLVITKKIITHANQVSTLRRMQILIVSNFNQLIQNAYGNYTIQVALEVSLTINL